MRPPDIKLIVTDLDRTLLRTDKTVSAYTAGVLERCRRRGILFAFATGRSETSGKRYIDMLNPDAVISNNGALVRRGGEVLYSCAMSGKTANSIISHCINNPHIRIITAETERGYFSNIPIDVNHPSWADYNHVQYMDFADGFEYSVYKISVEYSDDYIGNEMAFGCKSIITVPFSGENWVCFTDAEATKWHGVKALADYYGISADNVAAFGDDYNDTEMLKNCGFGVAVENAIPEVKSAAGRICGANDDDGVAKWLEINLLTTNNTNDTNG
jgi:hypothetical protein